MGGIRGDTPNRLVAEAPPAAQVVACDRGQKKVEGIRALAVRHGVGGCIKAIKADATQCIRKGLIEKEVRRVCETMMCTLVFSNCAANRKTAESVVLGKRVQRM